MPEFCKMSHQFAVRYMQVTDSICDYYAPHRGRDPYLNQVVVALEYCASILRTLESALRINKSPLDTTTCFIPEHIFAGFHDELIKITTSDESRSKDPISDNHAAYPFRRSTQQRIHGAVFELQWGMISMLNALQPGEWESHDLAKPEALIEHLNPPGTHSMFEDWFPIPDTSIDHRRIYNKRHMGTGLWLLESPSFLQWLSRDNSFLWLRGVAGCGKSVICSTAIQYTFCQLNMIPNMGIAFFYFSSSKESKQGALAMISSLLMQLDKQSRPMDFEHDISLSFYEKFQPDTPPEEELLQCLQAIIKRFQYSAYIFLDGMDEHLLSEKQASVLTTVETMRSWNLPNLHILITSCNKSDIRASVKPSYLEEVAFEGQGAKLDIANYIPFQLNNSIELQKWKGYQDTIQQVLTETSRAVYVPA